MAERETPELDALVAELDWWGFGSGDKGHLEVTEDGSRLIYYAADDESGYVLAVSDYDRAEIGDNPRPFLATALDALKAFAALRSQVEERDARIAELEAQLDPRNIEPCKSELWSWNYFTTDQVDPYWIRCTEVGAHDEHKDSNTGAHWKDI